MPSTTVSTASCKTYGLDQVRSAINVCLAPLGGIQAFIRPGMTVLLKPNLLTAAAPEQAITTHPAIVQTVAELAASAGAKVWIGDSPNNSNKDDEILWQKTGMKQAAEAAGAKLVPFNGSVWKHLNGYDYILAKPLSQVDLVIDLAKLKTHTLTLYTGAIKNLLGCIPGARKSSIHVKAPGVRDFSRMLVDILELVRPSLSIMDAVIGMEGEGPGSSGIPRPCGFLAASTDPVALDAICSGAMGYKRGDVLHIAYAAARNLGTDDPSQIELAGDPSALQIGRIQIINPRRKLDVPSWLSAPIANQLKLRPQVDADKCSGCKSCAEVCPAEAIAAGRSPIFDLKKCIGFMCCGEACPEGAITPHRSWIARLSGLG